MERSRQWAVRCMHEASLHERNCFLTLTYDDAHVPRCLEPDDLRNFWKRLRRRTKAKLSYFACGEYGERYGRPHYHACVFGYDPADKRGWGSRGGYPVWRSESVEKVWSDADGAPLGNVEIGTVTFDSAAYVARYVLKKVRGEARYERYVTADGEWIEPEFVRMSRRPAIGAKWFERYREELTPKGMVVHEGREMPMPRYYLKLMEGAEREEVEFARWEARRGPESVDERERRLVAEEVTMKARVNLRGRSLE